MPTYVRGKDGWLDKKTGEPFAFDPMAVPTLPRIITSDTTPPLRSMADGKFYTSKAAMRESYKASNNPKGINYQEVGDDPAFVNPKPKPMPKSDPMEIKNAIERAEADLNR
jgi:hypothetical protein